MAFAAMFLRDLLVFLGIATLVLGGLMGLGCLFLP
jgi:hypothetical protein